MKIDQAKVRQGLVHRFTSALPGGLGTAVFLYAYQQDPVPVNTLPMVGSVSVVLFGFAAPVILTGGLNKPFPPTEHLMLCSATQQRVMAAVAMGLMALPSIVRLLHRL